MEGLSTVGWTIPYWHDDIGKTFFAMMQWAPPHKRLKRRLSAVR
jgi:hypothetical protein